MVTERGKHSGVSKTFQEGFEVNIKVCHFAKPLNKKRQNSVKPKSR